jgi:hypothetical protein
MMICTAKAWRRSSAPLAKLNSNRWVGHGSL